MLKVFLRVVGGIVLLSLFTFDASGAPPVTLEPVSGLFFPELQDLNRALESAGFATLEPPMNLAGSWSHGTFGDWPVGASIAQGSLSASNGPHTAQLGLQILSLFAEARIGLSEAVPQLRAFASGGLALGQVTLILIQKPADEGSFDQVLKNPHDTFLNRTFFAALSRAGIEFKLGEALTLRGSIGYLFGLWNSPWAHASEQVPGPPKSFNGILLEFTLDYTPASKPKEK